MNEFKIITHDDHAEAHSGTLRGQYIDAGAGMIEIGVARLKSNPDALATAPSVLRSALELEKAAERALSTAREKRQQALAAVDRWNSYVDAHHRLTRRVSEGQDKLREIEARVATITEALPDHIGSSESADKAFEISRDIATAQLALPVLRTAQDALVKQFELHREEMRRWANQNGVPENALP